MEFASSCAFVPEAQEDIEVEAIADDDLDESFKSVRPDLAGVMEGLQQQQQQQAPASAPMAPMAAAPVDDPFGAEPRADAGPASGGGFFASASRLFGLSSAAPPPPAGAAGPSSAPAPRSATLFDALPQAPKKEGKPKTARVQFASAPRYQQEVDTNVVSFKCSTLASDTAVHTGDIVVCTQCAAAFNSNSTLVAHGDHSTWECEFCGKSNDVFIAPEEVPRADCVDYILKPAPAVAAQADETRIIFVVDISGSMCVSVPVQGRLNIKGRHAGKLEDDVRAHGLGDQRLPGEAHNVTYVSRLQAVQAAVDHQLIAMSKTNPRRQVGLVTFNNEVTIIGDGCSAPITLAGATLNDADALRTAAVEFGGISNPIQATSNNLSTKLFALEEGSSTALGPALMVAITMAAQVRGSQVVLCTDGLANVGIGSLEGYDTSDDAHKATVDGFYESLAATAVASGVLVSVISIIGEECKLDRLGRVADLTGGEVTRVSPLTLADNFQSILEKPIIATSVAATMFLHKGLYFRNAEADRKATKLTINLGNVNADAEAFYEFGVRREMLPTRSPAAATPSAATPGAGAPRAATAPAAPAAPVSPAPMDVDDAAAAPAPAAAAPAAAAAAPDAPAAAPAPAEAGAAHAAAAEDSPLANKTHLPFQLQVTFTKPDGMECMRVITKLQKLTASSEAAKKDVNVAMYAAHVSQNASRMAERGELDSSRAYTLASRNMLLRHAGSDVSSPMQRQQAGAWVSYMNDLDEGTRSSARDASSAHVTRSDEAARRMYKGKKTTSKMFETE